MWSHGSDFSKVVIALNLSECVLLWKIGNVAALKCSHLSFITRYVILCTNDLLVAIGGVEEKVCPWEIGEWFALKDPLNALEQKRACFTNFRANLPSRIPLASILKCSMLACGQVMMSLLTSAWLGHAFESLASVATLFSPATTLTSSFYTEGLFFSFIACLI